MLMSLPHVVLVTVEYAEELMKTSDVFAASPIKQRRPSVMAGFMSNFRSDVPDAYVLVNALKDGGAGSGCHSSAKTAVVPGSFAPAWNEEVRLSMSSSGHVVFNVFSQSVMAEDIFLGQASVDLNKHFGVYLGHPLRLTKPLHASIHPVYGMDGGSLEVPDTDSQGALSLSVRIPPIYSNMCGWWFDIKTNLFGIVYGGDRIWVVLCENVLYCYDSEFETTLLRKVEGGSIVSVKKTVCKLELEMECVELELSGGERLTWAWGNDAGRYKGLWLRALENRNQHHYSPNSKL